MSQPVTSTPKTATSDYRHMERLSAAGDDGAEPSPIAVSHHRQRLPSTKEPMPVAAITPLACFAPAAEHHALTSFVGGGGVSAVPPLAPNPNIKIELDNADLWRQFSTHTTEMIVTKNGRRMFPTLRYRLSGLEPNASYAVFLELSSGDDARYKFQNGRWIVAGRAEPSPATGGGQRSRVYAHPDSPAPGRIWMRQALSFHRVKLTNNMPDPQTHMLLNSMHKYSPRVYIMRLHDYFPSVPQLVASAHFPDTDFIAVTAYQNEKVIQLKIDHNPFAKGFRESGVHAEKRRQDDRSVSPVLLAATQPYATTAHTARVSLYNTQLATAQLLCAQRQPASDATAFQSPSPSSSTTSDAPANKRLCAADEQQVTPPQASKPGIWNPFLTPPQQQPATAAVPPSTSQTPSSGIFAGAPANNYMWHALMMQHMTHPAALFNPHMLFFMQQQLKR